MTCFCKVALKISCEDVTPNKRWQIRQGVNLAVNILLQLIFSTSLYHKNRIKFLCFPVAAVCRNAFAMSAIIALRWTRKRNKIKNKPSVMNSPVKRHSLNDGLVISELASNTTFCWVLLFLFLVLWQGDVVNY